VRALFDPLMAAASEEGAASDWKSTLQELAVVNGLGAPVYVLSETGPDHAKHFVAQAQLAGQVHGEGSGQSKKEAEQRAAQAACAALQAAAPRVT
jgi:ribonuclease-3